LKQRQSIVFIILIAFFFVPVACGKKGPPFLPDKEFPFRVAPLKAECENGVIHLKGTVVDSQGRVMDMSDIKGCRIYHACYALDNPPCEGCPIDYGKFKEITAEVTTEGKFSCRAPGKKGKGIHFFKIRLIGQKGEIGPFSDRAKLEIDG
jgi:predicted small lipoprotein YifL